jgi:NADH:ubiquinone oxidoreductase subunit 4 (subunit M)
MDNNQFLTDWGLSLIVFLPLVGAFVMMLIPKGEEQMHKVVALVASLASAGVGIAVFADFNYDKAESSSSSSTSRGSRSSAPGTSSHSTASRCRSSP